MIDQQTLIKIVATAHVLGQQGRVGLVCKPALSDENGPPLCGFAVVSAEHADAFFDHCQTFLKDHQEPLFDRTEFGERMADEQPDVGVDEGR